MNINQVILGDNQFFGVNHMSQDKGTQTYEQFKDINEIMRIMHYALEKGVTGVMFSTHPSMDKICDMIREDPTLKNNFSIYVNVPYIIKYVSMVTEMGMYNTMKTVLESQKDTGRTKFLMKSGWNAITLNFMGIFERLIDVELAPFHDLNVKSIFLHNTLCDLILSYNMADIVKEFDSYIKNHYHAIPGYGTLNFAKFSKFMDANGLEDSLIMASFNKLGFLMNPGRDECVEALKDTKHTVLAMATLASGRLKPHEAYEYLSKIGIKNVIVGLSSQTHADETFGAIQKYILGES